MDPHELFHFVEMEGFYEEWTRLRLTDDELSRLQWTIMRDWRRCPVVPGTGGLRKIRVQQPGAGKGKRGGARVCFTCFEEYGVALLIVVYPKSEKDDISQAGKASIKKLIHRAKASLDEGRLGGEFGST
jgi:hypothetical protein